MGEHVHYALARGRTIYITTRGWSTGQLRRTEVWFHHIDGQVSITGLQAAVTGMPTCWRTPSAPATSSSACEPTCPPGPGPSWRWPDAGFHRPCRCEGQIRPRGLNQAMTDRRQSPRQSQRATAPARARTSNRIKGWPRRQGGRLISVHTWEDGRLEPAGAREVIHTETTRGVGHVARQIPYVPGASDDGNPSHR